jgi:hypothetical protein
MIVEWAKDPSRVVEEYSSTVKRWFVVQSPDWHPACQYRFKPAEPKFIVVNGVYVPVPVRESLTDELIGWLTLHYTTLKAVYGLLIQLNCTGSPSA